MQFQQLGPYRLGKKLGQGGMGAVYEGVDIESGEAAAVKVLSPTLAVEEGFRVRFEAEIDSLKKLQHPNIVRLYGYGEEAGTLFYAMELVDGTSLEDELRGGRRFDWHEVTRIAIRLCRALKHAHDHGIIHRDLKPANLLLTSAGEVKLSDFGIARLFGNTRLTSDGGVIGTAEYMSPEQADGRTVTDRCDQYSLGGVLYALLAGRPPFRAKSLVEMLQLQRFAEPEPVTRFAPQTPAELARIIHQLLDKDPQKRFSNTLMLGRALEAMERGLSLSLSNADDFVLGPQTDAPSEATGVSGYSPLAPTLSPTQLAASGTAATPTPDLQATEATMAYALVHPSAVEAPPPTPEPRQTAPGRFTKVGERRQQETSPWHEALWGLLSPQTLALIVALAMIVGLGWYLMQPPSADDLYREIEAATSDGDADSLTAAVPKIETFLSRYPNDPRTEKLQDLQDQAKQSNPIQRAYSDAMRHSLVNPELALAKFKAMIDLYDDGPQNSETTSHYLKLAQLRQKRLQKKVDRMLEEEQALVASRLQRAAELSTAEPSRARRIYQGIVDIYAEKPWAAEFVEQARAALAKADSSQTSGS